jgi:hypothetical protein
MKPTILLAGLAALLLGADAPKDRPAIQEVEQALRALNAAYAKQDVAAMRRLITEDQVSITSYGGVMDRETQLKHLPDWKITEYKESGMKLVPLTKDTVRATYQLTVQGTYQGKRIPVKNYVVSIWIHRDGRWQEASYQETPAAGE